MSQKKEDQQRAIEATKEKTPVTPAPTHTGIDSIFIDGTGAVQK